MAQVLIDTNILVYAHEPSDAVRYAAALRAIEVLHENATGRLSAQILAEFVSATTRGRRPILTSGEAAQQAALLADAFHVFDLTKMIVLEAIRGVSVHRFSYYDAQIWATARLNQVPAIFSEDVQNGRRVEGVQFINPLLADFDLSEWS